MAAINGRTGRAKDRVFGSAPALGITLTLLLLVGMVAGCDTSDVTGEAERTAPLGVAAARIDPTPSQIQGIEALKTTWDATWAAKDAAAYAAVYAEGGELLNPVGGILSGRDAIQAQHAFLFNGPFAGSTSTSDIRRTVFLTGTAAMVDLNVSLTGYQGLPSGLPETEPGVMRTRVKWIVVKNAANREILAQQMTALAPGTSF